MPSYAAIPDIFNKKYASTKSGDSNRLVTGVNPPRSAKDGKQWQMTGTHQFQTNNPKSGGTTHAVPVWKQVQAAAEAPSVAKAETQASSSPSVTPPTGNPRSQVEVRREALERAQQYKTDATAIPRPAPPGDPQSPSFYQDFQAYGRSVVEDYLKGREVDQKRAELGIEEGAYFAKESLDRINPKQMNITQPDTWKGTLERLNQMKRLIG